MAGKRPGGTEPSTTTEPSPPAAKGKATLVPAIVIAVGLLGGGFLMGGRGGQAQPASSAAGVGEPPAGAQHDEPEPGEVLVLDPITLNLADGRFLKVGLGLQLPKGDEDGGGHGSQDDSATRGFAAPALDEAISVLGDRTYSDLAVLGGRDRAKAELSKAVKERYDGEVLGVLFTEFVMQ